MLFEKIVPCGELLPTLKGIDTEYGEILKESNDIRVRYTYPCFKHLFIISLHKVAYWSRKLDMFVYVPCMTVLIE